MADHHVPPVYPLLSDIWQSGHLPSGGPADLFNVPSQLYISPQCPQLIFTQSGLPGAGVFSTLGKFAPGLVTFARGDIVQFDNTVAEYHVVKYKEIFYKGFVSSFEGVVVFQCNANGTVPRTY